MAVHSVLDMVLHLDRATLGQGGASPSADGPLRFQPMASSLPPDMLRHMNEHSRKALQDDKEFCAWVQQQAPSDAPLGHPSLHTPLMQRQLQNRLHLRWRKLWQEHKEEVSSYEKPLMERLLMYQDSSSLCIGASTWYLLQLLPDLKDAPSQEEQDQFTRSGKAVMHVPYQIMQLRCHFSKWCLESSPKVRCMAGDTTAFTGRLHKDLLISMDKLEEMIRSRSQLLDLQLVVLASVMVDLVGVLADTFLSSHMYSVGSCHLTMLQVWELPGPTVQHNAEVDFPEQLVLSVTNMWQIQASIQLGKIQVAICGTESYEECFIKALDAVFQLKTAAHEKRAVSLVCSAHSQAAVHRCLTMLAMMQAELAPPQTGPDGLAQHPLVAGMVCVVRLHPILLDNNHSPRLIFHCLPIPALCLLRPQVSRKEACTVYAGMPVRLPDVMQPRSLPSLDVLQQIESRLIADFIQLNDEDVFEKAWPKERALALQAVAQQLAGKGGVARTPLDVKPGTITANVYGSVRDLLVEELLQNNIFEDVWCPAPRLQSVQKKQLGFDLNNTTTKVLPPVLHYLAGHPSLWQPAPEQYADQGRLSWTGLAARRWLRDSPGQFLAAQQQAAKPTGPDWFTVELIDPSMNMGCNIRHCCETVLQGAPRMHTFYQQLLKLIPVLQKKSTQWERAVADVLHAWQASNSTVAPSFTSISQQTADLAQGLVELFHLENKVIGFVINWITSALCPTPGIQGSSSSKVQHSPARQVVLVPAVSQQQAAQGSGGKAAPHILEIVWRVQQEATSPQDWPSYLREHLTTNPVHSMD